jgi:hypothetical protein
MEHEKKLASSAQAQPSMAARDYIAVLIDERVRWEEGSLKSAMDELYDLLAKCVGLFEIMARDDAEGERLRGELDSYAKEMGYKYKGETHTIVKIARAVFHPDKNRYSAYGRALKAAIEAGKSSMEVANYIRSQGGVDGVIKKTTASSAMGTLQQRAEQVWASLKEKALASVKSDALTKASDQAAIGKRVVLLATQGANGEYTVHEVVKATNVVNTVYASFFKDDVHGAVKITEEKVIVGREVDRDAARAALIAAMSA